MALPADDNIDFLVCDGIRQTPDGKLDIAGYYPTLEVKLDPAAKLPVSLNLTFVFIIKDGEGTFKAKHRIIDPLGKELHRFDIPDVVKQAGLSHAVFLPVGQIPIVHSGHYPVILELAGQPYRRSVRIYQ